MASDKPGAVQYNNFRRRNSTQHKHRYFVRNCVSFSSGSGVLPDYNLAWAVSGDVLSTHGLQYDLNCAQ